ncbi:NAD-dependent epimerase/dehydratase family protein [Erythrobacter rubeus]|uniref:NAD(P)-dependent oxidoreductase n=1 Tax=Erythrobacter rubeus TaxID=2760803 RepID=A0ABR8KSU8_9SPHN|nr:NAD(P)-dependent oxidoreductase [Erythrobacter rubeus]MBD2842482.1 NAD(P)-dependent oxidoreductase [Erythrobacter rubeus]
MSIAVTGATGFVGGAVMDAARQKRLDARALTRSPKAERAGVMWIKGTLDQESTLRDLIRGTDAVIHIAGLTNTPNPVRFEAANVTGTANMIAAAKAEGVQRFVFVSSLSAREPDLSAYGGSKARAEELVKASELDWTIVRPPAVYGPRDTDMFELFRTAKYGIVPVPPEGRTSIIHVEDLARLLIALVPSSHKVTGKIFEPWDDNAFGYEHSELGKMIAEAVGNPNAIAPKLPAGVLQFAAKADQAIRGPKAKLTPDRVGYMLHPDWVCDMKKAPPISLWQAVWSGEDGLKMTAEWYKAQGWL